MMLFGLMFTLIGSMGVFAFFPFKLFDELALDLGKTVETTGVVQWISETNTSINDSRVWKYQFRFEDLMEKTYLGTSYKTGKSWDEGSKVTVQYVKSDPFIARIKGTKINTGGYFGSFTLLFPVVGIGLLLGSVYTVRQRRWLLRHGEAVLAKVVDVKDTKTQVNYQNLFKLIFAFEVLGRPHEATIRTTEDDLISLATERHRNDESVVLLYDPRKPRRVLFAEALL